MSFINKVGVAKAWCVTVSPLKRPTTRPFIVKPKNGYAYGLTTSLRAGGLTAADGDRSLDEHEGRYRDETAAFYMRSLEQSPCVVTCGLITGGSCL